MRDRLSTRSTTLTMSLTGSICSAGMVSVVQALMSVSTKPGEIAVATTPCGPCSRLIERTREIRAAFAAA